MVKIRRRPACPSLPEGKAVWSREWDRARPPSVQPRKPIRPRRIIEKREESKVWRRECKTHPPEADSREEGKVERLAQGAQNPSARGGSSKRGKRRRFGAGSAIPIRRSSIIAGREKTNDWCFPRGTNGANSARCGESVEPRFAEEIWDPLDRHPAGRGTKISQS